MLKELHAVTKRIEKLSEVEHDMLREVHPTVEKIKESVDDVASAVGSDDATYRAAGPRTEFPAKRRFRFSCDPDSFKFAERASPR